jgi:dynein light intermediate chain 1, cytosolic
MYTTPTAPSQLQSLVHASLGIHSLLKRQPLKHNVIDRDKILVPPNWDSWGKIRVLREGFDVEGVSAAWSADLDLAFPFPLENPADEEEEPETKLDTTGIDDVYGHKDAEEGTAVAMYEKTVENSDMEGLRLTRDDAARAGIESTTIDTQEFLAQQLKVLDGLKAKAEEEATREELRTKQQQHAEMSNRTGVGGADGLDSGRVSEHIGPVQTNIGGIQVDADDMLRRMVDRRARSPDGLEGAEGMAGQEGEDGSGGPVVETENLQRFFSDLMNPRRNR